ncbi:MAG: HIT domain-containing protein [Gammaproteobacteria bacterium]|nr:HIT domain-containing protein [Gammaproteobacteria bacterium]
MNPGSATGAGFALHPQLAADTHPIGELPLCRVLLMDDARFLWCLLVPRRAGVREIHELPESDRRQLWDESHRLTLAMRAVRTGDKFNLAALGNQVPQLHLHHLWRRVGDTAWPAPVWGTGQAIPYAAATATALCRRLWRQLTDAAAVSHRKAP